MIIFRQFDYFRKSTSPEQIKPTCIGGIISLCCIFALTTLIYNELQTLSKPIFKKNATVSTDPHKNSHIMMNFDVLFPNVPCYLIDINIRTSVNMLENDEISRLMTYRHVSKRGEIIDEWKGLPEKSAFKDMDLNDEEKTPKLIMDFFEKE